MSTTHLHAASSPVPKRVRIGERTMLACIMCKQRKLKCDGGSPKCQNCVKSDRDCLVEDPATGLQRPRDYMQTLEARVAYLESLLQDARPDIALDHLTSREAQQESGPARPSPGSLHPKHVNRVSSDVALLCVSAAGREPHYFGPSSAISFSRIASQALGLHTGAGTSLAGTDSSDNDVRESRTLTYPSRTAGAALSKAYFENVHPQYPFLHVGTFETWARTCHEQWSDGTISTPTNHASFFVFMVYAIGSLALGSKHYDQAEDFYVAAMNQNQQIFDMDNLESLQAILACAVYSVRSPVGASLWKISGLAMRTCVELGYHRSTERFRQGCDPLTREISKRCFWTAYDIDRSISFVLGRPVAVPDHAIDAELPLDLDDEHITAGGLTANPRISSTDPSTGMTGAIHVVKLRRLWSRIGSELYSSSYPCTQCGALPGASVEELRKELEDWRAASPSSDRAGSGSSRPLSVFASQEWFQLAYGHSILILYRQYITESGMVDGHCSRPSRDPGIVERAFEECYTRSREMCRLYKRVYQSPTVQFTWGSVHILFLAGLTYLFCLWRSPKIRKEAKQADVISTCMACASVLVVIAERWNVTTTYRDLFDALSERTIAMLCQDNERSNESSRGAEAAGSGGLGTTVDDALLDRADFLDLQNMSLPVESEWLLEELLRGVKDSDLGSFYDIQDAFPSNLNPLVPNTFWINPYAVHFRLLRVFDMVHVDEDGVRVGGADLPVNSAGFIIHAAIHRARPDINAVCHVHSSYGRAWSNFGRPIDMLNQDCCMFFDDLAVYDSFGGVVFDKEEGARIASSLGPKFKNVILKNHGLLTCGGTVAEAAAFFIALERACQTQLLTEAAIAPGSTGAASDLSKRFVGLEEAAYTKKGVGNPRVRYMQFMPEYQMVLKESGGDFLL